MQNRKQLINELRTLLSRKQSREYYAKRLNLTVAEINDMLAEINGTIPIEETSTTKRLNLEKGEIEVNGYWKHEPTPEDIVKAHNIDTTEYKLSQYWSKQKEKGFQVSACFSKIKKDDVSRGEAILEALVNHKSNYKPLKANELIQNFNYTKPSSVLISLPDFHLDKKEIDKRTIEDKINNYKIVLDSLVRKCYNTHFVEEIVFVIGNDFYHTDSIHNTTTKGTPLFVDTDWNEAYELGFDLLVDSINKMRQFCNNLHIILICGNHPKTKEFYLAHALEMYFKPDKNIHFDRSANELKVHEYGNTLMCFNHGSNINDKLPLAFATSFYKEWGKCKYKEVILGDKHHNSEKIYKSQGENMGVRMRILPALCGTDQWHQDNLFINSVQSGIALVYDKEKGKCSEFEERI